MDINLELAIRRSVGNICKEKLDSGKLYKVVEKKEDLEISREPDNSIRLTNAPNIIWNGYNRISERKLMLKEAKWFSEFRFTDNSNPRRKFGSVYSGMITGWMEGKIGDVELEITQSKGDWLIKVEEFEIEIDYARKSGHLPRF